MVVIKIIKNDIIYNKRNYLIIILSNNSKNYIKNVILMENVQQHPHYFINLILTMMTHLFPLTLVQISLYSVECLLKLFCLFVLHNS